MKLIMKKIIFLLLVTFMFFVGCSEKIILDNLTDKEMNYCDFNSDCQHVRGCHEDGGSDCVNIKYIELLSTPKENCDINSVWPCYTCVCQSKKCVNVLNKEKIGC